jgi:NAD(P)-dependent dehydrogenase (short-subunit alcohol dehydrogenase family)
LTIVQEFIFEALMPGDLAGRAVLVTGAARGLGRAIALAAAAAGAHVGAFDIDEPLLTGLPRLGGSAGTILPIIGDVASREAVMSAAKRLADAVGGLDAVVSNAALLQYEPLEEITESALDRMLAIGIKGAVWGAQALLAHRRSKAAVSLLHMTSPVAERGAARTSVYAMTKAAVASFTRTLAVELGPQGVRVNALAPGSIPTPGAIGLTSKAEYERRAARIPLRRLGSEEEVARAALFLLSDSASFITGEVLHVDGGLAGSL